MSVVSRSVCVCVVHFWRNYDTTQDFTAHDARDRHRMVPAKSVRFNGVEYRTYLYQINANITSTDLRLIRSTSS